MSGRPDDKAAPGEGRHATAGLTDGKSVTSSHPGTSDVPAPGNTNLGKGGATSMSGTDNAHPGAQGTPAAGMDGQAGDPEPTAKVSKEQPEERETRKGVNKDGDEDKEKKMTPEEANAAGDGTFGDGKFDAAAPGAGSAAQKLESKARKEAGEEGKINVSV